MSDDYCGYGGWQPQRDYSNDPLSPRIPGVSVVVVAR